jgi:Flp pilus assembly protein CpaB
VIGGLLVVIAVVGTFLAYDRATAPNTSSYVVAAHDIHPGEHIHTSDLTTHRVDLTGSLRGQAFASTAELADAVTLGPIDAGELVQRGLVTTSGSASTGNLVSFAVGPEHAVAGAVRPGDRIAVLVSGQDQTPKVVANNLQVVDIKNSGGGLAGGPQLVITVAADANQAVGVAAATNPDNVTVVRTTGVAPSDSPSANTSSSASSGNSP